MPGLKPLEVNGDTIRALRVINGRSRREVCSETRISPNRLFRIEHGISKPTQDEVGRILGILASDGRRSRED